jgi:DNA helicase II / ATP-dependent DNA helicase PcrA
LSARSKIDLGAIATEHLSARHLTEQQRTVVDFDGAVSDGGLSDGAVLLVEGPARCGRTTALVTHALHRFGDLNAIHDRTLTDDRRTDYRPLTDDRSQPNDSQSVQQSHGRTSVFIVPTDREARSLNELFTSVHVGAEVHALSPTNLVNQILRARQSVPTRISQHEWKSAAARLLMEELGELRAVRRHWSASEPFLQRKSLSRNAIEVIYRLRSRPRNTEAITLPRWSELVQFADRVDAKLGAARLADITALTILATATIQNADPSDYRALQQFSGRLLIDDAHRLDYPTTQLLLALIGRSDGPSGVVVSRNSTLSSKADTPADDVWKTVASRFVILPPSTRNTPSRSLKRLRHRALEADAIVDAIQVHHSRGIPFRRIAVVMPAITSVLNDAIQRSARRRGVPIIGNREELSTKPLVIAFRGLLRFAITRDPNELTHARVLGLLKNIDQFDAAKPDLAKPNLATTRDPVSNASELLNRSPGSLRELSTHAFTVWQFFFAKLAVRDDPTTCTAISTIIQRLNALATSSNRSHLAVEPSELLAALNNAAHIVSFSSDASFLNRASPGSPTGADQVLTNDLDIYSSTSHSTNPITAEPRTANAHDTEPHDAEPHDTEHHDTEPHANVRSLTNLNERSAASTFDASKQNQDIELTGQSSERALHETNSYENDSYETDAPYTETVSYETDSYETDASYTDAVELVSIYHVAQHDWDVLIFPSMVEGNWPRVERVVEGGWDIREVLSPVAAGRVERHDLDHASVESQRLVLQDACRRASTSIVAIAAPDPGVLVSRFVEGWPEADLKQGVGTMSHTTRPAGSFETSPTGSFETSPTGSFETSNEVPCFPLGSLQLSATRLDTFENCPLNFAYQYVAGVRGAGGVPASVGTMVHATLEAFLLPSALTNSDPLIETPSAAQALARAQAAIGDRSLDRLLDLLDQHWDSSAFPYRPQEADYRSRAEQWVRDWWDKEVPKLQAVIAVEHKFNVAVGPHNLTGSIDRISISSDGLVEIVDYKTGSPPARRDRIDSKNLQLATYHLAASSDPILQPYGVPEILRLHYLAEGVDVDQPVRPGHVEETKARILSMATDILSESFEPSVEAECKYCNFKVLCPLQSEGRSIESTANSDGGQANAIRQQLEISVHTRAVEKVSANMVSTTPTTEVAVAPSLKTRDPDTSAGPAQTTEAQATDPLDQESPAVNPVEIANDDIPPNEEQFAAITHAGSPLLIVAGAGSGKTTVLAKRIVHLVVHEQWRPDQILGLTFSNKAAANLRARVSRELGAGNDATITTYHGFGAMILRTYGERIGYSTAPVLLDRARAWQLLLDSLDDVSIENRKTGNLPGLVSEALALASACSDHLVNIQAVLDNCREVLSRSNLHENAIKALKYRIDLCNMALAYQQAKHATNCIDFGDQIARAYELVEQFPDVRTSIQSQHPVPLLDEYQDTNYAQRRLIELLYRGSNNLTAVGDDMQSIYAFRGAHIRNLLEFENHFPGAKEVKLQINHRSGAEIIRLAQKVQSEVDNARPKALRASGAISDANVKRFVAGDEYEEAKLIASECLEQNRAGTPWAEMAILCRKRRLIPTLAETLMDAGIPVEVIGLGGLLQRPEITDVVAWLEIVAAPPEFGDTVRDQADVQVNAQSHHLRAPDPSVSLLRILRGDPFRLCFRDLAALARAARKQTTAESRSIIDLIATMDAVDAVPDLSAEGWKRVHAFNVMRTELVASRAKQTLTDLIEEIVMAANIWNRVDERGYENIHRFIDLASRFSPLPLGGRGAPFGRRALLEFLEYLQLIVQSEDELGEAVGSGVDAVNIMTIHQAKGLEYETVFVPGLAGRAKSASKIFPDVRAAENGVTQSAALPPWLKGDGDPVVPNLRNKADLDVWKIEADNERDREEKRLFYVAVTRAKRQLILSAAHWYSGSSQPQGVGPFYDMASDPILEISEMSHADASLENPEIRSMQRRHARYVAEMSKSDVANNNGKRDRPPPASVTSTSVTSTSVPSTSVTSTSSPQPSSPAVRRGRPNLPRRSKSVSDDQTGLFLPNVGLAKSPSAGPRIPTAFATTSLSNYVRCPRLFYWTAISPMPRRASESARIGSEVHRWIERQANGQLSLTDLNGVEDLQDLQDLNRVDDLQDLNGVEDLQDLNGVEDLQDLNGVEDLQDLNGVDASRLVGAVPHLKKALAPPFPMSVGTENLADRSTRESRAQQAFLNSRYATLIPRHVEKAFGIQMGAHTIRGRIDAIYSVSDFSTERDTGIHQPDSHSELIEIVDFKTGRAPAQRSRTTTTSSDLVSVSALHDSDPTTMQLDVYGLVAVRLLGFRADQISVTACYLGGDALDGTDGPTYLTRKWSNHEATAAELRIASALAGITDRRFDPDPGSWCNHCDFSSFCDGALGQK